MTAAAGNGAAVEKTQLPAKTGSVFYYSRHRTVGSAEDLLLHPDPRTLAVPNRSPACNPPYREIAYSRMNLQPGVIVAHTTGPTIYCLVDFRQCSGGQNRFSPDRLAAT